ncbi:MAG: TM1812 family CRISPR-associated protein [Caldisphaera sp.]
MDPLQNKIKDIVFNSEISQDIIDNELNNIHVGLKNNFEELVKQAKKDNFKIPLYKFYKTKSDEVDKQDLEEMIKSIGQTKRNFIAHAGLLKELVIVDVKDLVDLNKNMEDFDKKITKAKLYYNNTDENFDKILEILNKIVQGIDNLWK